MRAILGHIFGSIQAAAVLVVVATLAPKVPQTSDRPRPSSSPALDQVPSPDVRPIQGETAARPDTPAPDPIPDPRPTPRPSVRRVAIGFDPPKAEPAVDPPPLRAEPRRPVPPPIPRPGWCPEPCPRALRSLDRYTIAQYWVGDVERFRALEGHGFSDEALRREFGARYPAVKWGSAGNAPLSALPSPPAGYTDALSRDLADQSR